MHQCNGPPKLTLNAAPNLKCWSLSLLQMVTLFQAQAQAQATMAATLFYRKKVSMFKITVSLLLARNNKHKNFKNPTLELASSSRLSCLFFFFTCCLLWTCVSVQESESC
jgi:hypothetical protein